MARTVREMPEPNCRGNSKYPWNQWLDGRVWELTPGVDFKTSTESFRALLSLTASRNGFRITTVTREGLLYIQAHKK